MWGFSIKRFFVTLGLSILVWIISMVVQQFFKSDNVNYGLFSFAKSCDVTGYPLAQCISEYDKGRLYFFYLINLSFWFWVIHFFWNIFSKKSN